MAQEPETTDRLNYTTKMLQILQVLCVFCVTSILSQNVPDRPNIGLTGPPFRELQLGQNPELLQYAALYGETAVVTVDSPSTIAIVQENVDLYINCLPWLQKFPGAELRWWFQALDSNFEDFSPMINEVLLTPPGALNRRIGGEFNEWLNISSFINPVIHLPQITGRYACEACFGLGTLQEECNRANISVLLIGEQPFLDSAPDDFGPDEETPEEVVYRIGTDFCIPRGYNGSIVLRCAIVNEDSPNSRNKAQAFPPPDRAWDLDGDVLYRGDSTIRDNMDFFMNPMERLVLAPDAVIPSALVAIRSGINEGGLLFNFQVVNSTSLFFEEFESGRRELQEQVQEAVVGTWTCTVNNTFGSESASSNIRRCGLDINSPPTPFSVGESVTLTCENVVSGTLEWLSADRTVLSNGSGLSLNYTISPVSDSLHGSSLTCRGSGGSVSTTISVDVPSSVLSLTITESGSPVAGTEYSLLCEVSTTVSGLINTPTAQWIFTGTNPLVTSSGHMSTLTFPTLRTLQATNYTCVGSLESPALTQTLEVEQTTTVRVEIPTPEVSVIPPAFPLMVGTSLTLTCSITVNPAVDVNVEVDVTWEILTDTDPITSSSTLTGSVPFFSDTLNIPILLTRYTGVTCKAQVRVVSLVSNIINSQKGVDTITLEVNVLVCPTGTYQQQLSNNESACLPCPDNSVSVTPGSQVCLCLLGYYRTNLEGPNIPCSRPPSPCRGMQVVEDRTQANTITIRWQRPEITGRDDFYYNIFYSEDNQTFTQHNIRPYIKQDLFVDYSLSGLRPLTSYTIRVMAENGVSGQEEREETRSCQISGKTGDIRPNPPSLVLGLCTVVVWTAPRRAYGRVIGYDIDFVALNVTVSKGHREMFHIISEDEVPMNIREQTQVQVRAKVSFADGEWSEPVPIGCSSRGSQLGTS